MHDHRRLAKLSQCAWKFLSFYLKQGVPVEGAAPGVVVAVQTFGDFLNLNLHQHIIVTDGCFNDQDGFMVGPQPDPKALEQAFWLEVFKMLKKEGPLVYLLAPLLCSQRKNPRMILKCRLPRLNPWLSRPEVCFLGEGAA